MKWQVEFYKTNDNKEPVKEWLDTFDIKIRANVQKHFAQLEKKKLNLKHPFIKHLETQLYELNIQEEKRVLKIIFFPNSEKKFILLHGFIRNISKKPKKLKAVV